MSDPQQAYREFCAGLYPSPKPSSILDRDEYDRITLTIDEAAAAFVRLKGCGSLREQLIEPWKDQYIAEIRAVLRKKWLAVIESFR